MTQHINNDVFKLKDIKLSNKLLRNKLLKGLILIDSQKENINNLNLMIITCLITITITYLTLKNGLLNGYDGVMSKFANGLTEDSNATISILANGLAEGTSGFASMFSIAMLITSMITIIFILYLIVKITIHKLKK